MKLGSGIARALHLLCAEAHRGLAAIREWRADLNLDRARRHAGKAREHDRRADAITREPTELDGGVR